MKKKQKKNKKNNHSVKFRIFQKKNERKDFSKLYTAWKVSKYGVFSGPFFPAFDLNTVLYSVRIQENMDKKTSVFGHFSRTDTGD